MSSLASTGWVYNKVSANDGDWIMTGKQKRDISDGKQGRDRIVEMDNGSVYRLVGPRLAVLKDWCKITSGPLSGQYVGTVRFKPGAQDGDEYQTSRVTKPIERENLNGMHDRADRGVIETISGSRYCLEGPPLQTLVGPNGTEAPTPLSDGRRIGHVFGKKGAQDGDESACSRIVRYDNSSATGSQIAVTESGSRYRLFPSPY